MMEILFWPVVGSAFLLGFCAGMLFVILNSEAR